MKSRRSLTALFSTCLLAAQSVAAQVADPDFAESADIYISSALDAMGVVPGLAVAVVRTDSVIYLRGFGMADQEAGTPVTPETAFYVASVTKPFTALAAALLDARSEIDLDASLASSLPDVAFDPAVKADSVTLRAFLTHTSGLSNDAIVFRTAYSGEHTPSDIARVLTATEPNPEAPRGTFGYTNLGYNVLSFVLDRETGTPWQALLDSLVFTPAGMDRTTAYVSELDREGWPVVAPYTAFGEGDPEQVYLRKTDQTMHAAGGMYTTATDLARWLEVQINDGRLDGRQVFPAEVVRETHRRHAEANTEYGPFGRHGYGLGWYDGSYDGDRLIHHFGSFAGFFAHTSFMPEHNLGVAVVANEEGAGGRLATLVATYLYDRLLEKPDVEARYATQLDKLVGALRQHQQRVAAQRAERASWAWTLSAPPEAYAGTYVSPLYGTAVVTVEGGAPALTMGVLHAVSTPYTEPDTVRVELVPGQGEVVAFELNDQGEVTRLRYDGAVFERVR